jgi:recombinational DNA repair protein (RecF pathway)
VKSESLSQALCLRSLPYRETDCLVSYYTPTHGRVDAVVAGAKRPNAKLTGATLPLNLIQLTLLQGKSPLQKVVSYQSLEGFHALRLQFEGLSLALAWLEFLYRYPDHSPEVTEGIWLRTLKGLYQLEDGASRPVSPDASLGTRERAYWVLWWFDTLAFLGYSPETAQCVLSQEPLPPHRVQLFSVALGGPVHPEAQTQLEPSLRQALLPVSGKTLDWLSSLSSLDAWKPQMTLEEALPEADTVHRAFRFITHYVREKLHCPFSALDWLQQSPSLPSV